MKSDTVFTLHYSAAQNQEVQAIRNKYLPRSESKLEELKRLDYTVQTAGMLQGMTTGVIGCLIFGLGMCLAMRVIGGGVVLGAVLGLLGMIVMIFAYPMYRSVFVKAKKQHTPRILELAAELANTTA